MAQEETGAIAILYAVSLLVMIGFAALVLDIGVLRVDRRAAQTTADFASIAGAHKLGEGSPSEACVAALEYFSANTPSVSLSDPEISDFCTEDGSDIGFPASDVECYQDPNYDPLVRTLEVDPYVVTLTWPVDFDPDESDLYDDATDGHRCERFQVQVDRTRGFVFASTAGFGTDEGQTGARAVARGTLEEGGGEPVGLVVLDPHGRNALCAAGQGGVWVRPYRDGDGNVITPGMIVVDSDGTIVNNTGNCTSDYAIYAQGTSDARILAGDETPAGENGHIFSYALLENPDHAWGKTNNATLAPEPQPHERVTRAPVDERFLDAINDLRDTVVPATNYPTYDGPCVLSETHQHIGNLHITCDELDIQPGGSLTINGGNVIFDGTVILRGELAINDDGGDDYWVYFHAGADFEKASSGARLRMGHAGLSTGGVTVYMDDGAIRMAGDGNGSGELSWYAPSKDDEHPFHALALWSEGAHHSWLQGGADLGLEGVFFLPSADPFEFSGKGAQAQQRAQFITHRFLTAGQGTLEMVPDPDHVEFILEIVVRLIR